MKVIIFSSDQGKGGINQYAIQLFETCISLGWEAKLFIPSISPIEIPEYLLVDTIRYQKKNDIFGLSKKIDVVVSKVNELNPDYVIFTDDAIFSAQILMKLNRNIKTLITIHDVTPHPSSFNLRRFIVLLCTLKIYRKKAIANANAVILLSENSKQKFENIYPRYSGRTRIMLLGAHPPIGVIPSPPPELDDKRGFVLFFGRIEKYKGIKILLEAYNTLTDQNTKNIKLIIAGNGKFQESEKALLKSNPNVVCINRFIEDEEMVWLFRNCIVLVAPYIEASQSGVIPMAYHFGKPVIASNISGIREFVINGKTGYVFDSKSQLVDLLAKAIDTDEMQSMNSECIAYEDTALNWGKNLERILSTVH